jgi:hypothetical protein
MLVCGLHPRALARPHAGLNHALVTGTAVLEREHESFVEVKVHGFV